MLPADIKSGEKPLSRASLLGYGSLAVPLQALMNPILIFLPPFYAVEVGLDLTLVGMVFFLARSWDAITDPIVGALSDRTTLSWGRRRPWIAIGTPLLLLASYFALLPPASATIWHVGFFIFLFYAFWTMVFIPYQSWGAEVSSDYRQRTRVAAVREAGSVLGVVVGIGIPLLLVDPIAEPLRRFFWPGGLGLDSSLRSILTIIFVTVAILLPITAWAACKNMPDAGNVTTQNMRWRQTAMLLKRNHTLRRLIAGYFLAQLGFLVFLSSVQLLVTQGLQLQAFLFLIFIQHLVAVAVVPLWLRVADRMGKHRAYCTALLLTAVGLLALNLVPAGNLNIAIAIFLFNGLGSSGKLIFPPAIAADTVDYDTLKTGTREAGTHMAALNLTNKATFALSIGLAYPLLAMAGFDATGENSPQALGALMLISTILPAVALLLGALVMWNFPLDRRKVQIIQRRLYRRTLTKPKTK